ncbi:MAG TPA: alkaline phosphatase family protein [Alphaproteobacteria bacterium]|nr:alkaline phosphatase family protein [Alphaproteobacteria bacterium]
MPKPSRFVSLAAGLTAAAFAIAPTPAGAADAPAAAAKLPPIKHVFVITLENESAINTFGPDSPAPYLSKTLVSQGAFLPQYFGTGHASLDNYIAMVSGQGATPMTRGDCQPTFQNFKQTGLDKYGQVVGNGCVYPKHVKTIGNQMEDAGLTWRGYMEDMGNNPARESATCGHPVVNKTDGSESPEAPSKAVPRGDQYATRHNGFVYFHAIIDSPNCKKTVVNLDELETDLQKVATTRNVNFITPNVCNDGHDAPCVNGKPGGLVSANAFLRKWVPLITESPAFKKDGLLIINFDEGGFQISTTTDGKSTTYHAPGASCCGQEKGPNLGDFPATQQITPTIALSYDYFGGDNTGAVVISPFVKPGTISRSVPYNHYSLLKTIEDIFHLSHLGYAAQPTVVSFGADVFTQQ